MFDLCIYRLIISGDFLHSWEGGILGGMTTLWGTAKWEAVVRNHSVRELRSVCGTKTSYFLEKLVHFAIIVWQQKWILLMRNLGIWDKTMYFKAKHGLFMTNQVLFLLLQANKTAKIILGYLLRRQEKITSHLCGKKGCF